MEEGNSLLQKMRRVFSENEDQERVAEEIIEKIEEGYQKGVLAKREMKMICNVFGYMDSEAKDIMTHRKNIVGLYSIHSSTTSFSVIPVRKNTGISSHPSILRISFKVLGPSILGI